MITQYKHIFTEANEEKTIRVNITNGKCDSNCIFPWMATGTSYDNSSSYKIGQNGDSITFKNNLMKKCNSVWDIWCENDPTIRLTIHLIRHDCTEIIEDEGGANDFLHDKTLSETLDYYKNVMNEKYGQIENKVNEISKNASKELEKTISIANELMENGKKEIENAKEKIANAKNELAEVKNLLETLESDGASAYIDYDKLAATITQHASYSSVTQMLMTEVVAQTNGQIGGWIRSAATWNVSAETKTSAESIMNTLKGYQQNLMEFIDTTTNTINSLNEKIDVDKGEIIKEIKTITDNTSTTVGTYLDADGRGAISGAVTNLSASTECFGGFNIDLTLGSLNQCLSSANTATNEALTLSSNFDLEGKSINDLIAEVNGYGETAYTSVQQELTAITEVVHGYSGWSSSFMESSSITLTVKDDKSGARAGLQIATKDGEGHIILDADKVIIDNNLLVGTMNTETITLGSGATKFLNDGSGHLANSAITWDTQGNFEIKSTNKDGSSTVIEMEELDTSFFETNDVSIGSSASTFNADGSGWVASKAISWDKDGNMSIDAISSAPSYTTINISELLQRDSYLYHKNNGSQTELNKVKNYNNTVVCGESFINSGYKDYQTYEGEDFTIFDATFESYKRDYYPKENYVGHYTYDDKMFDFDKTILSNKIKYIHLLKIGCDNVGSHIDLITDKTLSQYGDETEENVLILIDLPAYNMGIINGGEVSSFSARGILDLKEVEDPYGELEETVETPLIYEKNDNVANIRYAEYIKYAKQFISTTACINLSCEKDGKFPTVCVRGSKRGTTSLFIPFVTYEKNQKILFKCVNERGLVYWKNINKYYTGPYENGIPKVKPLFNSSLNNSFLEPFLKNGEYDLEKAKSGDTITLSDLKGIVLENDIYARELTIINPKGFSDTTCNKAEILKLKSQSLNLWKWEWPTLEQLVLIQSNLTSLNTKLKEIDSSYDEIKQDKIYFSKSSPRTDKNNEALYYCLNFSDSKTPLYKKTENGIFFRMVAKQKY